MSDRTLREIGLTADDLYEAAREFLGGLSECVTVAERERVRQKWQRFKDAADKAASVDERPQGQDAVERLESDGTASAVDGEAGQTP